MTPPARRTTGSDFITFREAEDRYAQKTALADLADVKTRSFEVVNERIDTLALRIDGMVPRAEHENRWKADDKRFDAIDDKLEVMDGKIDEITQNYVKWEAFNKVAGDVETIKLSRLPTWFVPTMFGIVGVLWPPLILIIDHLWRH